MERKQVLEKQLINTESTMAALITEDQTDGLRRLLEETFYPTTQLDEDEGGIARRRDAMDGRRGGFRGSAS